MTPKPVTLKMEPGPCLFCGRWVEVGRVEAGATNPEDPCWNLDGDYGCDMSPITSEEGTGDHARPYDLALRILKEESMPYKVVGG